MFESGKKYRAKNDFYHLNTTDCFTKEDANKFLIGAVAVMLGFVMLIALDISYMIEPMLAVYVISMLLMSSNK